MILVTSAKLKMPEKMIVHAMPWLDYHCSDSKITDSCFSCQVQNRNKVYRDAHFGSSSAMAFITSDL